MSVLVKGMKMPKDCWNCPLLKSEPCPHKKHSIAVKYIMNRHEQCPLVEIPAADEVPVVHGTWLPIVEANEDGSTYQTGVFCSECGHCDCVEPNYCPHCGAIMDGGEKDGPVD